VSRLLHERICYLTGKFWDSAFVEHKINIADNFSWQIMNTMSNEADKYYSIQNRFYNHRYLRAPVGDIKNSLQLKGKGEQLHHFLSAIFFLTRLSDCGVIPRKEAISCKETICTMVGLCEINSRYFSSAEA
jgi:hypothetical protein